RRLPILPSRSHSSKSSTTCRRVGSSASFTGPASPAPPVRTPMFSASRISTVRSNGSLSIRRIFFPSRQNRSVATVQVKHGRGEIAAAVGVGVAQRDPPASLLHGDVRRFAFGQLLIKCAAEINRGFVGDRIL